MRISPRDWQAQPWANGQGITHELARWPAGAPDYTVRIAVAEMRARAEFSSFAGYERWLAPLDGEIALEIAGVRHVLGPGHARAFDGAAPVIGEPLGGALVHDLNVIVKRGRAWHAQIATASSTHPAPATRLVFVIAGTAHANGEPLAARDALVAAGPVALVLAPGAMVALVELPV